MFPDGSVGCISSNQEKQFGLESLCDKRLVQFPDVPEKLSKVLDQQLWQSMASGEKVPIIRKNKLACTTKKWTPPCIAAANYLPDYKDKCGQVARRLALVVFETQVPKTDGGLKQKIVKDELVVVLLRCIAKYRTMVDAGAGWSSFDKVCPAKMTEHRADIGVQTNHLAAFIQNGDDRYQIVHTEGRVTSLTKLNMVFSSHMRNVHKIRDADIGQDHHAIVSHGFKKEIKNLCKICDKPMSKTGCLGHYNTKNRTKKTVFVDMEIVTKDVSAPCEPL